MREARLKLVVTNLLVARATLGTVAATPNKWNGNPVTDLPPRNALTNRLDDAGQLVTGNVWQRYVRIVSLPAVPVTPANTTRHDPENDAAVDGYRIRYLLNLGQDAESPVDQGFHY